MNATASPGVRRKRARSTWSRPSPCVISTLKVRGSEPEMWTLRPGHRRPHFFCLTPQPPTPHRCGPACVGARNGDPDFLRHPRAADGLLPMFRLQQHRRRRGGPRHHYRWARSPFHELNAFCYASPSDHVFQIPHAEPSVCSVCNGQKTFEIVHNRCIFTDKQMIKLQETPDKVQNGVNFGAGQRGKRKMWTRQS